MLEQQVLLGREDHLLHGRLSAKDFPSAASVLLEVLEKESTL